MEFEKLETISEFNDSISINGTNVNYRFLLEKGSFKDTTEITSFTYINTDSKDHPVIFITNGGPGSGVVWLLLGLFGPERVHFDDIMNPPVTPPYSLEKNPFCLLDIADLVLIDPPGTGYSKINEETKKEYESVDNDAVAVAQFIRHWIVQHERANSPLYFFGESYGTVRGPAVVEALFGGSVLGDKHLYGISLNGIILLGTAFSTGGFKNRLAETNKPAINLLTCAATYALHTGKDPYQAAEEAWTFAPEYARLLFLGRNANDKEVKKAARRISWMTGLKEEKLIKNHLRYTMQDFLKEAIENQMIGYYDGRYLMPNTVKEQDYDVLSDDSGMGMFTPAFSACANLFVEKHGLPKMPYDMLNCVVNTDWDRDSKRTSLTALENVQRRNKDFRIFFATGLFDMCTVAGNVRYTVANSDLDLKRVQMKEYPGGHMAYIGDDSAEKFVKDIREFITGPCEQD